MNCAVHQDIAAVAECATCGVGMCADCVNASEYKIDHKAICRSCNYSTIRDIVSKGKKEKIVTIVKLVINGLFLLFGALTFSESMETGFILFAIGGIPTAWKLLAPNDRNKLKNDIDDATSADGGLLNSMIRFIVRVIFTVIIGAIAAPILFIINIVKLLKANNRIKKNKTFLLNFNVQY